MVEITYQMVLSTLQTLALIVGIAYYLFIMRNSQRTRELALKAQELTLKAQEQALETRQAQLFMNIYTQVYDLEFWNHFREVREQWEWEDYDDYYEKYRLVPEKSNIFSAVGSYFEGIGVLVKRNLIDVTFVDDLISGPLMSMWQKFEPVILEERRRKNVPTFWEWFGYLYDRVKEIAEIEHGPEHVVDMQRLESRPESDRK